MTVQNGEQNSYESTSVGSAVSEPKEDRPWVLIVFSLLFGAVHVLVAISMISQLISQRNGLHVTIVSPIVGFLLPALSLLYSGFLFITKQFTRGDRFFSVGFITLLVVWGLAIVSALFF